ncbi:MAG: hypothetical protein ACFCBW_18500 [Candidatus Competibacterales bacterium]
MRKFFSIVGVLLALVAGAHGYLWWSAQQRVNAFLGELRPVALADYAYSIAWPWGVLELHQVTVVPADDPQAPFRLDRAALASRDFAYALQWALGTPPAALPDDLTLTLEGLTIPLATLERQGWSSLDPYLPVTGPMACGQIDRIGAEELAAMGYGALRAAVEVNYRSRPGEVTLSLVQDSADMMRLEFFATASREVGNWQLEGAQMTFVDQGYIPRKQRLCTLAIDQSLENFLVRHAQSSAGNLTALGVRPSRSAVDAYRLFLTEGGRLELDLDPLAPVTLDQVLSPDPGTSLAQLAGLRARVNGLVIDGFDLAFDRPVALLGSTPAVAATADPQEALDTTGSTDPVPTTEPPGETVASPARSSPPLGGTVDDPRPVLVPRGERRLPPELPPPPPFQPVAVEQLADHVGAEVRIHVLGRRTPYRGFVESVVDDQLQLRARVHGGEAVFF